MLTHNPVPYYQVCHLKVYGVASLVGSTISSVQECKHYCRAKIKL